MLRSTRPATRHLASLVLLVSAALTAPAAAQQAFDKAEFAARRAKLLAGMPDGVAIVLGGMEHAQPVRFRQSPDFYYLTGIEEPGALLVLNGATKNAAVFAMKRPQLGPSGVTPQLRDQETPQERYGLPVQPMESFFTFLSFAAVNPGVKKLYMQVTPPDDLLRARHEVSIFSAQAMDHPLLGQVPVHAQAIERIRAAHPLLQLADVSPLLDELRWVKTPYEIERLRRSGQIGAEAVAEAIRATRPGMYEYEIAAAAQYVNTRLGARGDGFPPIVPSGPLTPIVHYMDNRRQMQAGEIVYIDYGSDWEHYTSDITRTWPVSGKFSTEQEKMYRCVLDARNAIIAAMKPGVTVDGLRDAAEPVYTRHGYRDAFLQTGRYVGHFVGISVHDVGAISGAWARKPFQPGVVFNVEPVLEFPDKQIHLRLEDTILITAAGAENMTAAVPAEVDRVYALVRQPGINSKSLVERAAR
ncbi:MAG: Xaa-Pro peptidase family protein [Gemmatimonadota bacterium]|nr:Xaa-Pro peptidase family protein [Gemmatimonadota bacterium]